MRPPVAPALRALFARPIAHRGLHGAPSGEVENTRGAFEAAAARGYGVELDVQLTADGEAVVFHDFALERLTGGAGRVDALTAAALAELTLKGSADRVEPLAAVLARLAGRAAVVIEVKSRFDGDPRLAARAAAVVGAAPGVNAIKSFDPFVVEALARLAPPVPRGIVAMSRYDGPDFAHLSPGARADLASLAHLPRTRPDFLSWRVDDLPLSAPPLAAAALALPVMAWTVRSPEQRARAAAHADRAVFEGYLA